MAIELALAALKRDNDPTQFFRSLGVLKREHITELTAQQGILASMRTQRARIGKVPFLKLQCLSLSL
jgi:hypothetical protein